MSSSNNHNLNQGRDAPPSNQFEMEIDDDDYDPGPEEDILVYTTSRSDGRDKIRRGNVEIDNYPIGRDLIPTTKDGITSYFKEVDMNDDVSIDWRINLAEGCKEWAEAKNLKYKWSPMHVMFENFPDQYRLYAQYQTGEKYGADERVDYFLYGHPKGLTARYRTVDAFLPHCAWLIYNPGQNSDDCNCEVCTPPRYLAEGLEILRYYQQQGQGGQPPAGEAGSTPVSADAKPKATPKRRNRKKNKNYTTTSEEASAVAPLQPPPQSSVPAETATPAGLPSSSQALPMPTPLPIAKDDQQIVETQAGGFMYRPGEVIWYAEGDSGKMGLALITSRSTSKGSRNEDRLSYDVRPLADPFHPQGNVGVPREDFIRPFLAYSPPAPHTIALQVQHAMNPQLDFSEIDWPAVHRSDNASGRCQVDGAVFAAKHVDKSFTPLKIIRVKNELPKEIHHIGIFWGCEKIWLGEAVRLRLNGGQDIMVLQTIVQRIVGGHGTRMDLLAVGDVYTLIEHPFDPSNPPTTNPHLPTRVLKDLEFRNRASIRHRGMVSEWKLTQAMVEIPFTEVRGRWYEARNLLPSIEGQQKFGASLAAGRVGVVGYKLNNRWESGYAMEDHLARIGTRTDQRLNAFVGSIPRQVTLNDEIINLQSAGTGNEHRPNSQAPFQQGQRNPMGEATFQEQIYSNGSMTENPSNSVPAEGELTEGAFVDLAQG